MQEDKREQNNTTQTRSTLKEQKKAKKEKKPKKKRGFFGKLWIFIKVMFLLILIVVLAGIIYGNHKYGDMVREAYKNAQEKVIQLDKKIFLGKESTKIYDADNKLLTELVTHEFTYLPFEAIPDNVKYAIIAIEDERFLEHDGVDYKAIARAGYELYKNKGKITQGGSTITQQLVKNSLLTQDKTYTRKLEEVFIALELEKTTPKSEILEYYLNNIYFGHGAYGIESASNYYFSKSSKDLTLEQTAFLLAIPNNPSLYDPIKNKENTLKRQQRILRKMHEQGYITEHEFTTASLKPVELEIKKREIPPETYLVSYAISDATKQLMKANGFEMRNNFTSEEEKKQYQQEYTDEFTKYNQDIRSGGYIIKTSLDQGMQNTAQDILNKEMSYSKDKDKESGLYKRQASTVILDNKTGLVKAIVGGRTQDGVANTFNRGFLAHRQPGSAIKPILVYTQALETKYLASSTVVDKEIKNGPRNVTGRHVGNTTVEKAVVQSINTIPYQLIQEFGVKESLNYLKEMNFSKIVKEDEVPVVSIGGMTYGTTPLELASAYSTLSRNGEFLDPTSILSIEGINKGIIYTHNPTPKRVYDAGASYLMTQILQETAKNKGKSGLSGVIEGYVTASKTGTTNAVKDVWFAGYSPYYTTVVWVGEDTPKPMINKTSYDDPLLIWNKTMTEIHKGLPKVEEFTKPTNALFEGYVNERTGKLSYTQVNGWKKELIPLSRMKKQEEAEQKALLEKKKKQEEEAKKRLELEKQKAEERKKQEELKRKEDEKLDKYLQAQGSSLQEENSRVYNIEKTLKKLKNHQVYKRSDYATVDYYIEEAQRGIDSLLYIDFKEKYQQELNTEMDRVLNQKDQVERAIIYEQEKAEREAIRAEEERLKEEERKKLQEQLERETQAEKERLEKEKAEQEAKEQEQEQQETETQDKDN